MPYFEEVLHGLRLFEPNLYHFCLTAKAETIRKRLLSRNYTPEANPWCYERIDRCLMLFSRQHSQFS